MKAFKTTVKESLHNSLYQEVFDKRSHTLFKTKAYNLNETSNKRRSLFTVLCVCVCVCV